MHTSSGTRTGVRRWPHTLLAALVAMTVAVGVTGGIEATTNAATASTSISTCESHIATGGSALARRAAWFACRQIGQYPYVFGGGHGGAPGPTQSGGLDCSGFMRMLYYQASGKDLLNWSDGNNTTAEHEHLAYVSKSNLLPGDLVFFDTEGANTISHVAMYLGHGYLIEEYDNGYRVKLNTLSNYGSEYHSAARVSGTVGTASKYWITNLGDYTYYSPTSTSHNGYLHASVNYVFCKRVGRTITRSGGYNDYWLYTTPDSGTDRWFSAYNLTMWGNDVAKDNAGQTIPTC